MNDLQSQVDAVLPKSLKQPPEEKRSEAKLNILDNQVEKQKVVPGQKPIRTYESDVAEALAKQQATLATMAIAESQKKTGSETISNKPPSQIGKKIFVSLLSIIFVAAGTAGAYYLYLQSPLVPDPRAVPVIKIQSLVTPDIHQTLKFGNINRESLISTINSEFNKYSLEPGAILELIPGQEIGSTTVRMTGSQFIETTGLRMPDILKRSLTDQWMLGVYSGTDLSMTQNFPFILFKTDFFQNAFAGMLRYEPDMIDDLSRILDYEDKARIEDNISTTSIASFFGIRGNFEDRVILNRDVREFISERGELLFLYTFIDKDTLLITTSEVVIPAIIERIEKQTYVR